eukprot:s380_g8.t1
MTWMIWGTPILGNPQIELGSNKELKTLFMDCCVCCAAITKAVHKTSSCPFYVGQILPQHFSHECSNLLIHSLKASQLRDDVLEDVFLVFL